jgi:hypothetical protein
MSTPEILTQIDAYLLCLRQVRSLLDGSEEIFKRHHVSRKRVVAKATEAMSTSSAETHMQQVKVQRKTEPRKKDAASKPVDAIAAFGAKLAIEAASLKPEAAVQTLSIEKATPFLVEPKKKNRPEQAMTSERTDLAKAINGAFPSRVVVISAEEVQKAREQAHPSVKPPRTQSTVLSGRKAFDALFGDNNFATMPTA